MASLLPYPAVNSWQRSLAGTTVLSWLDISVLSCPSGNGKIVVWLARLIGQSADSLVTIRLYIEEHGENRYPGIGQSVSMAATDLGICRDRRWS